MKDKFLIKTIEQLEQKAQQLKKEKTLMFNELDITNKEFININKKIKKLEEYQKELIFKNKEKIEKFDLLSINISLSEGKYREIKEEINKHGKTLNKLVLNEEKIKNDICILNKEKNDIKVDNDVLIFKKQELKVLIEETNNFLQKNKEKIKNASEVIKKSKDIEKEIENRKSEITIKSNKIEITRKRLNTFCKEHNLNIHL
jgi:chromosome segregation ATPase